MPEPDMEKQQGKRAGDQISVTVGDDAQFVAAGKDVQQTIYYVQPPKDERARRNRQAMLKLVHDTWVKGVLEKSLYNEVLIELGMELSDDAVANPWDMVIHVPEQEDRELPKGTKIVDVFDEMNQSLLILGEPGSGKTTMLLELARDAISRAQKDETLPIPVVFNLSSWSEKQQTLADWLVDEFSSKYRIPKRISRNWLDNDNVFLLLDGLDEVKKEHRAECVSAINGFRDDHMVAMATCCRTTEYQVTNTRLNSYGAVVIQPLTLEQLDEYMSNVGNGHRSVMAMIRQDSILQEFVESPLTLNIIMLAYEGIPMREITVPESADTRRKRLFDAYIARMLERGKGRHVYADGQTIKWLRRSSRISHLGNETILLIENIQPYWLQNQTWFYFLISRIVVGVLIALSLVGNYRFWPFEEWVVAAGAVMGCSVALVDRIVGSKFGDWLYEGFWQRVVYALLVWMMGALTVYVVLRPTTGPDFSRTYAVMIGLLSAIVSFQSGIPSSVKDIQLTERFSFSWHNALVGIPIGMAAGLITFVVSLYLGDLGNALLYGFLLGTGVFLLYALRGDNVDQTSYPNQGIALSARNSVAVGLGSYLAVLSALTLFWTWQGSTEYGIAIGNRVGIIAGMTALLGFGFVSVIRHYTLRLLIWTNGSFPLQTARFLDYCHRLVLVRKVGGGYIFIHRMLMEHFAEMTDEDIERIAGSAD